MNNITNIAVILAGGSGQRFGSALPKQFLPLAGKTIIEHSIEAFEQNDAIDEIVVVMNADYLPQMQEILNRNHWKKVRKLLPGGAERHFSTLAAIKAYEETTEANLIFHDAARPAVSQRIINEVADALKEFTAVAVVIPATDTVFEVSEKENCITGIPSRNRLRCAQTPQSFRINIIREAYRRALQDPNFTSTDDCGVLFRYCPEVPIHIIPGETSNRKLTYPEDTTLLEQFLNS